MRALFEPLFEHRQSRNGAGTGANTAARTAQPEPEQNTSANLVDQVRYELAARGAEHAGEGEILAAMEAVTGQVPEADFGLALQQLREIQQELSGLGPLTTVLGDARVTDVVANPDGSVWLDRGNGMEQTHLRLEATQARELATRLAMACGARLDDAHPYVDGVIDDLPPTVAATALRVHAMLSPPVRGGACISLRTLQKSGRGLADLHTAGMMPREVFELLQQCVAERRNLLVTGGTGAGKTTLLAALLGEVSAQERVILVEDTPELMPTHPHVLALAAREGNADGAGEVGVRTLLRQCLRMRPDRIVVGEIRGAEIADLLVALNTGHAGSAGTMHVNSAAAVPGRLIALGAMAGLNPEALNRQAADGIDVVIHLERVAGVRRVASVSRTAGLGREGLRLVPLWQHAQQPATEHARRESVHAAESPVQEAGR